MQIERLGNRFTPFVNLLLEVEVGAQGLAGHNLAINYKENIGDGGVDAGVRDATQTDWLPAGDSAWQFKTADHSPKECAAELEGAGWAHERIRAGGSYVLVVFKEVLPAAWEIGRALALHHAADSVVEVLVARFELNPIALVGYLAGRVEQGDESAFDDFLDSPLGAGLTPKDKVALAARGPVTNKARERVLAGARTLPVAEAAAAIFGWQPHLSESEMGGLVDDWLARLTTQADYDALIDRLMTWLFQP
ncbi:MAG TPA: hypothetical protein VG147_06765 [Solirubrobacteraceae bacterium]|nr:hypothetical protein [Solirubrobacteraceae bacterium]